MKQSWLDDLGKDKKPEITDYMKQNKEYLAEAMKLGLIATAAVMQNGRSPETFDLIMAERLKDMDRMNERIVKDARPPVQCEAKCSYCCYQHVLLSCTEAFHIVRWMQANGLSTDLKQNAELVASLDHLTRFQKAIACPLLKNQKCSIYEVRPMPCRSYFSSTRHLCKKGWEDRFKNNAPGSDILVSPQLTNHAVLLGSDIMFFRQGHQMVTLELADAITQAGRPGAFDAWLAGEQVFIQPEDNQDYAEVLRFAMASIIG